MRKACNNYNLIVNDDKFIGVALGFDFTSEHEWGIEELRRICGIPESNKKNMGVKNRTISICPMLILNEETINNIPHAILYTGNRYHTLEENKKYVPDELKYYAEDLKRHEEIRKKFPNDKDLKDNLITAWDESSFGVAVRGEKEVGYLKELHQEFLNKNIVIAITSMGNPFGGSSLSLLIADRIPKDVIDLMYNADKKYWDRIDYEEKIGMKKLVDKNKSNEYHSLHYFMACSSRWINYEDEENREKIKAENDTKYDIRYWVNYSDDDNNSGWYTVEEIKQWLTGTKKLTEIRKAHID